MGYIHIYIYYYDYVLVILLSLLLLFLLWLSLLLLLLLSLLLSLLLLSLLLLISIYIYSQIESIDGNPNLLGKYLLCDLDCLWTHPQQLDQLGPSQLGSQQVTRMKLLINLGAFSHFSPLHTFTSHRLWWCGDSLSFRIIGENWLKWWFRAHET